ncbi:TIGR04211 family SH3 domain-containing protein [Desulfobulbus sp. F4]|nr:TIGR04211 family SH3 domain-containing protein [Desulfobulbus sp. F4]
MNRRNRAAGQHRSFAAMILRFLFPQLAAAVLLLSSSAGAENLFVSPNVDIPVRRGAGEQYRIIKIVRVNDKSETLEEKNGWFKVRFQDGDEGWLPKSLLTSTVPVAEDVRGLRTENEHLRRKNNELSMELNTLKEHQDNEGDKLAACITKQNEQNKIEDKIKAEHKTVEDINKIGYFLAGAGVLLAGWLLGRLSHSSPRRKNSLR